MLVLQEQHFLQNCSPFHYENPGLFEVTSLSTYYLTSKCQNCINVDTAAALQNNGLRSIFISRFNFRTSIFITMSVMICRKWLLLLSNQRKNLVEIPTTKNTFYIFLLPHDNYFYMFISSYYKNSLCICIKKIPNMILFIFCNKLYRCFKEPNLPWCRKFRCKTFSNALVFLFLFFRRQKKKTFAQITVSRKIHDLKSKL